MSPENLDFVRLSPPVSTEFLRRRNSTQRLLELNKLRSCISPTSDIELGVLKLALLPCCFRRKNSTAERLVNQTGEPGSVCRHQRHAFLRYRRLLTKGSVCIGNTSAEI